ncbi:patellin-4 [Xylariales sp. AK1849]|nr:patellin-4 [Xylariales sp. AK1849]
MAETDTQPTAPVAAPEPGPAAEKGLIAQKTLTPIQELFAISVVQAHQEIWGVTLDNPDKHIPSQIVFQKYLNANDGDVAKAKDQLIKTLEWRAEMKPLELLKQTYSKEKFDGVGYVTAYTDKKVEGPEAKEIFTWNIYGIIKNMPATFGDKDAFIRWRVAVQELALQELSLSTATKPITAEYDPYKIYQVHDYKSVSFFRQDPSVKAASSETIKVFTQNYPELLKEKFFVNVPAVMGWMYGVIKLFVAPKTLKKFHPMASGASLTNEFAGSKVEKLGEKIPKEYGGKGEDLKGSGKQTHLG